MVKDMSLEVRLVNYAHLKKNVPRLKTFWIEYVRKGYYGSICRIHGRNVNLNSSRKCVVIGMIILR